MHNNRTQKKKLGFQSLIATQQLILETSEVTIFFGSEENRGEVFFIRKVVVVDGAVLKQVYFLGNGSKKKWKW